MLKNIIANIIGRFWGILSNFLFIPLYIKFLGIESYSVISFSLVIAGLMGILDAGLTATLSREFALKTNDDKEKNRIFSTLETCYFIIVIIIIAVILLFSDPIAHKWLNLESIDPNNLSYWFKIIGIGIAFQFLANFYTGGLLGLEYQVKANLYQIGLGIVRNGLVVLPIFFLPSLEVFFIWQTCATIIYAVLLRISLKKMLSLKYTIKKSFQIEKEILRRVWKFAGGMLLISIIAAINTQLDKLAISNLLPIQQLGYYVLAITLAQGLVILVSPISTALLPRFTSLFSENKKNQASFLFHQILIFISIIVFSISANIIFNAKELLWVWTGDNNLVMGSYLYVLPLTIGMLMLSIAIIPYTIAIANGYTKLNNYIGIISLVFTLPGYWLLTAYFGAIGAAITFATVQFFVTIIYLWYINKLFLENKSFISLIVKKLFFPSILCFTTAFLFSIFNFMELNRFALLAWIGFTTLSTLALGIAVFIPKAEIRNYSRSFTKIFNRGL